MAIVLQFAPPDDTSRNHDVLPSTLANERKLKRTQIIAARLQGVKVALVDLVDKIWYSARSVIGRPELLQRLREGCY